MNQSIDMMPRRDIFYFEAKRVCHERNLPPESLQNIELALRHSAFMRAIQPFVRALADIHATTMPSVILGHDGRVESHLGPLSDAQREAQSALNDMVILAAQDHGLAYWPLPSSPEPQDKP